MIETSDDRINFHAAESGKLDPAYGLTGLKYLPDIGAFKRTVKWNKEHERFEFQTDREGVERVSTMAGEALAGLHNALHGIGVLLANSDPKEITDDVATSIGWTIAGLAELAMGAAEVGVIAANQLQVSTPTSKPTIAAQ